MSICGKVFATTSFFLATANVDFSTYGYSKNTLQLTIKWSVTKSKATPNDVIKVYNSKGDVVHWFYTSSGQSSPGATASASGSLLIKIARAGAVTGGYDLGFFPSGGEFEAANAPDWIDWKKIGW